jgi:hypothetical protein
VTRAELNTVAGAIMERVEEARVKHNRWRARRVEIAREKAEAKVRARAALPSGGGAK